MAQRCKYTKADGARCRAFVIKGSDYCFSHDPEKAKEKALAVMKGGLARRRQVSLPRMKIQEARDIKILMATLINEVRAGLIDSRDASCIGYLSGVFLKSDELSDITARLTALEKYLKNKEEKP